MLLKQILKRALILSAFFVSFTISFLPQIVLADNCTSNSLSVPEKATVKWVYDGDTLLLTDKRKIRIIGIDTPEVKHHKQKAEAFGARAREALRELLKKSDNHVFLRYSKEKYDRFSRVLAHVYLPDGTNISKWLLEKGYASTLNIPPNIQLANCYSKAESLAQNLSLNIWRLKSHKIKDAESLPRRTKGFVRLMGTVKKIKHHKKSLIMELDSNTKSHIQIKITKRNLRYFKSLDLDTLWNQTIIISGILKKRHGKRSIYLNHPTQIKIVEHKRKVVPVAPTIKWSL